MGIISTEVEVIPSGKNIQYYKDLGYDIKWREPINVKIEDLLEGSHSKIEVMCDFCNKNIMKVPYHRYIRCAKETGKYACNDCAKIKRCQTMLNRYGFEYGGQVPDFKEQIKKNKF